MSMNTDPLLGTDLDEQEIRLYRYLLALQTTSFGNRFNQPLSAELVRAFLSRFGATKCSACERYFFSGVLYCTVHGGTLTVKVSKQELDKQVEEWEEFRRALSQASRIKINRASAIRLYYYGKHPQER